MSQISNHHRHTAHASPALDGPTRYRTPEQSGMKMDQHTTQTSTALLYNANGVDTPETNSLCCAAAGIIAPLCATAEVLIPHEKLREAAIPDATLIAQNRPPAQPVVGYTRADFDSESPSQIAVNEVQINERTEFEKEFPVPEGLQYCVQRDTYITAPAAKTSDSFAREHYAYRAGFAAWKRRGWKHAGQLQQLEQTNACLRAQLNATAQQQHQQARDYLPPEEA
ncbi:hypothetical protein SAMN04490185_4202 [Pseudomonas frederiksbergensis]|uniref:Uncharacterized protein n=1 Tax=Pseudomonas frederiksbergensis TaxID=104087 RepID=A0A1H5DJX7_9PSED|nr:hypothetical protein [Pseudomonas frederiksbergensis]SED79193.1 hypothetical protein SAMN04490185_4202 [Pseudomonas frederiksbergensis]